MMISRRSSKITRTQKFRGRKFLQRKQSCHDNFRQNLDLKDESIPTEKVKVK